MTTNFKLLFSLALLCIVLPAHFTIASMCSVIQDTSGNLHQNCSNLQSNNESQDHCGNCDHLVSWSEKGVACETCGKWYHAGCLSIGSKSYQELCASDVIWHCDLCGKDNYSMTMFDLHGVEQV